MKWWQSIVEFVKIGIVFKNGDINYIDGNVS